MEQENKKDKGKLRYDLIPWEVEEALAEVLTFGAEKYSDNSWQSVESDRYLAALRRHLAAWQKGEENDKESGLSHMKHALCNMAFLFWFSEQNIFKRNFMTVPGKIGTDFSGYHQHQSSIEREMRKAGTL